MWPHFIYLHRCADTDEPFYLGKGKLRRGLACYERAYAPRPGNKHWMHVVAKHGLVVEIIAHCRTDADAQHIERLLIAQLGRKDRHTGPLINKTDGGDGHAGIVASAELRARRSLNSRGKRSDKWTAAMRKARKNGGNGGVVKHGDKLPEAWVQGIAKAKVGSLNPYFGKPTAVSKRVQNTETGVTYESIARAAKAEGLSAGLLYQYLDGSIRRNPTPLVRIDG